MVPEKLQSKIKIGQIVEISLRNNREKGIVFKITDVKPDFETLEIGRICTPPLLSEKNLECIQEISEYNFCSYSKTLALFLPPKLWRSDGLPPTESYLKIYDAETIDEVSLKGKKQKLLLEILQKNNGIRKESDLRKTHSISLSVIHTLLQKQILQRELREKEKPEIPLKFNTFPEFTKEQNQAIEQIKSSKKTLLFGPPNSGKTLLAFKCIAEVLQQGKSALFLLPERLLSESLIQKFAEHFPEEICSLSHSFLSEGEKMNVWWKVKTGHTKIVFGTRSSLFLPFPDLGIIVMDEEQDNSFKNDQTPRYHTRKAAEIFANIHNAKLLLQSATPSFESFFRAQKKKDPLAHSRDMLQFCEVKERFGTSYTPKIHVVDLRDELSAKNYSPFSNLLQQKIKQCLEQNKQILLFLNRRGKHSALVCRQCGVSILCSQCKNRSTLHEDRSRKEFLLCHHCGNIDRIPPRCKKCNGTALKGFGIGTQELEQEVKRIFPSAKVVRADRDSTATKNASLEIFEEFSSGKADIMIGTQIISKGLDIPNIGLVGIILADTTLHLPDFRASEYAFQLLTQVSGRTARKGNEGEIVLQTYLPEHPAVQFCQRHDYLGFYAHEMKEREALFFPPYSEMIRLIFVHPIEKNAKEKAEKWEKKLREKANQLFQNERIFISLAPAMSKYKFHKFHYHIFLMGEHPEKLLEGENLSGIRVDRDSTESF